MTVDFFVKSYDFSEFKIKNAILKNGLLEVYVTINAHLDLIANGYRPSLDVDYDTVFVFSVSESEDVILSQMIKSSPPIIITYYIIKELY